MELQRLLICMEILEVGREKAVSVESDAPVAEVAETMFDKSVGSVLVEEDGDLAGIITDRDLVIELMSGYGAANIFENTSEASDFTAGDLMMTNPVTVEKDMEFPKVLREMENAAARRIPVTDDGDVIGIVTLDDCLKQIAGESEQVSAKLNSLADVVRQESPE